MAQKLLIVYGHCKKSAISQEVRIRKFTLRPDPLLNFLRMLMLFNDKNNYFYVIEQRQCFLRADPMLIVGQNK